MFPLVRELTKLGPLVIEIARDEWYVRSFVTVSPSFKKDIYLHHKHLFVALRNMLPYAKSVFNDLCEKKRLKDMQPDLFEGIVNNYGEEEIS